ncbi:MAG: hypothetical protein HC777_01095 [Hyphomonadaceae bacterium]|nr:hypothetical protein [Hyphomonadaceae bacterium]
MTDYLLMMAGFILVLSLMSGFGWVFMLSLGRYGRLEGGPISSLVIYAFLGERLFAAILALCALAGARYSSSFIMLSTVVSLGCLCALFLKMRRPLVSEAADEAVASGGAGLYSVILYSWRQSFFSPLVGG